MFCKLPDLNLIQNVLSLHEKPANLSWAFQVGVFWRFLNITRTLISVNVFDSVEMGHGWKVVTPF